MHANRCLENGLCETVAHGAAETMPPLLVPDLEGLVRGRDRDLGWAARRDEGKVWKGRTLGGNSTHGEKLPNWVDYDWTVECDGVGVSASWDEAEDAFAEEGRGMNVDLLDLTT